MSAASAHSPSLPRSGRRRGRGAPKGNRNALKHGLHTGEVRALRREMREVTRQALALIASLRPFIRAPRRGPLAKTRKQLGVAREPSHHKALGGTPPDRGASMALRLRRILQ